MAGLAPASDIQHLDTDGNYLDSAHIFENGIAYQNEKWAKTPKIGRRKIFVAVEWIFSVRF